MSLKSWINFLPAKALVMARKPQAIEVQAPSETPAPSSTLDPKVLIFAERLLSSEESELLVKMMAAIGLTPKDYVVEAGEFPVASCPWVIAVGLSEKKLSRLEALRPDPTVLPQLSVIQSDVAQKREAWEKLKQLQIKL